MNAAQRNQLLTIFDGRRGAIADAWYQAIEPTSFPSVGPADVRRRLDALVEQAITTLLAEPFKRRQGQTIGAALAEIHFVQPETLSRTLNTLHQALTEPLTDEQKLTLQSRLAEMLSEIAAGFFEQARTMILGEQEEIRGALSIAHQHAETALRQSEERLQQVITNAPIVLFALDADGVFTLSEGKGLAALNLKPGEVVGRSVFDVYRDMPIVLDQARRALAGETFDAVMEVAGLVFEIWYAPFHDETGAITGAIGVAMDITARKRADEERRAFEQLRTDFIANISHDLRTPLHHIKGYALLLLQRGSKLDDQTRQDFLQTISDASDQLTRLISDLLETSQNTTGDLKLQIKNIQLDKLVRSVAQRWRGISSHQFAALVPADVPSVPADRGRIEQVLDNLLTNVVRHTPEQTSAELSLEITNDELVISVIDHGPGVAAEHLPHLFERFYQVEPSAGGPRRGSGLGLFICKRIIEQHGGRIWAEPTPETGTTVRFTLPRSGNTNI
jgi:PAS domain S-box-containing protein